MWVIDSDKYIRWWVYEDQEYFVNVHAYPLEHETRKNFISYKELISDAVHIDDLSPIERILWDV